MVYNDKLFEEYVISRFKDNISNVCNMYLGEGVNCWLENFIFN